ncbi:hypothetical protein VSH64_10270 [Amycolatopsis rhabdoformis]|uniref:FCD domain-containing protein n=1 Tax=Amycolatopsis rhabdoformis TaxID=1448059 RepID=A0ABZ1IDF1_9PSEU|nr:hypothetical protein [Amycolatopsis rhabdoformis]WSE32489.1 hypothetical protein VSH64_10270 [Amycolatopsis rhabdoformis]
MWISPRRTGERPQAGWRDGHIADVVAEHDAAEVTKALHRAVTHPAITQVSGQGESVVEKSAAHR